MQPRSEGTRKRILEAASTCFAQNGYDATSVDDICRSASVSKGAFYHHFTSKQAVFQELLENWLRDLDAQLIWVQTEAIDVPQALVQMAELSSEAFRDARSKLSMFLEFWTRASREKQIWQKVIAPYQRYRDFFAELIQHGVEEGTLQAEDVETASRLLVALAVGLILQATLETESEDWKRITSESMKILLKGLAV